MPDPDSGKNRIFKFSLQYPNPFPESGSGMHFQDSGIRAIDSPCKITPKSRDRHAFSELDSSIGKTLQKRFRIEICAIKNPLVKKNRIKNGFSYQKIALEKETKCPVLFKGKMSKKRPFVF